MSYLLWCTAFNKKETSSPGIAWQEGWHYSTCMFATSIFAFWKPHQCRTTCANQGHTTVVELCWLLLSIPISLYSATSTELLASSKIWQQPNVFYLAQGPQASTLSLSWIPTLMIQLFFLCDLLADPIADHSESSPSIIC